MDSPEVLAGGDDFDGHLQVPVAVPAEDGRVDVLDSVKAGDRGRNRGITQGISLLEMCWKYLLRCCAQNKLNQQIFLLLIIVHEITNDALINLSGPRYIPIYLN